jgi:hypothetical protein
MKSMALRCRQKALEDTQRASVLAVARSQVEHPLGRLLGFRVISEFYVASTKKRVRHNVVGYALVQGDCVFQSCCKLVFAEKYPDFDPFCFEILR